MQNERSYYCTAYLDSWSRIAVVSITASVIRSFKGSFARGKGFFFRDTFISWGTATLIVDGLLGSTIVVSACHHALDTVWWFHRALRFFQVFLSVAVRPGFVTCTTVTSQDATNWETNQLSLNLPHITPNFRNFFTIRYSWRKLDFPDKMSVSRNPNRQHSNDFLRIYQF